MNAMPHVILCPTSFSGKGSLVEQGVLKAKRKVEFYLKNGYVSKKHSDEHVCLQTFQFCNKEKFLTTPGKEKLFPFY